MEKEHDPILNETRTVWEKIKELSLQDLLITAIHNLSPPPTRCVCVCVCVCTRVWKGFFFCVCVCAFWLLYNESLSGGWMDSMSLEKTSCNLQVRAETIQTT